MSCFHQSKKLHTFKYRLDRNNAICLKQEVACTELAQLGGNTDLLRDSFPLMHMP